jgi:hypothetical protein
MTYNLERATLNEYDMGKILRGVLHDRYVYVLFNLFEVVFAVVLTGPGLAGKFITNRIQGYWTVRVWVRP